MIAQKIATHDNTTETIITYNVAEDIEIILAKEERVFTVFFGEEDFTVRWNRYTSKLVNDMLGKTFEQQIFLVQTLKIFCREYHQEAPGVV